MATTQLPADRPTPVPAEQRPGERKPWRTAVAVFGVQQCPLKTICVKINIYKHVFIQNLNCFICYTYELGPKLRVTKAVMSKSYRFRSFPISNYMALEHVKQRLLIWRSMSIHPHGTNNRNFSWSAVCWTLFFLPKCERNFPSEQLTVARLLLLQILLISLDLFGSKLYSMVGFKARLDHPK